VSATPLRTPEERFALLPRWPHEPRYLEDLRGFDGLRLHYVDTGPPDAAETFLCLHGEPTWAYLYRRMIPVFTAAGHRVVAPDFFGFGRSDKPAEDATYTFGFHRETLVRFVEHLDLRRITLVCQDWGGILGLTLPMQMPERFARLLVMNTALPDGRSPSAGFDRWKAYSAAHPDLEVAALIGLGGTPLDPFDIAAYGAPFPDARYKAGVRRFPDLVPLEPAMEGADLCREARAWLSKEWAGESFMAVGAKDVVLGPDVMEDLRASIAGCPEPMVVAEAGHFVQEWGEPIARRALEAFGLAG
jgi:pimeloyl-ACP methyl ester carboxylesterase